MPIQVDANIHHLAQDAFGQIAYSVMDHIFAVHNTMGRFLEHEFVNTTLKHSDRTVFQVADQEWRDPCPAIRPLRDWLLEFLCDIGAGLDVHLYESAVSHFFGGDDVVLQEVDVLLDGRRLGKK